jgi:hypothetical protein
MTTGDELSLFGPDVKAWSPPLPAKRRHVATRPCCEPWATYLEAHEPDLTHEVLHRLAHSRVPFSSRLVGELGHVSRLEADAVCRWASRNGWVHLGRLEGPPRPDAGRLWIGQLAQNRAR